MQFDVQSIDPKTGELLQTKEEWLTLTEIGKIFGTGPRQTRETLFHMGVLQKEGDKLRVIDVWVREGIAMRLASGITGREFDVIGPEGQRLIAEAWEMTVTALKADLSRVALDGVAQVQIYEEKRISVGSSALDLRGRVHWLMDHWQRRIDLGEIRYSDIPPHRTIAHALGSSHSQVSPMISDRERGLRKAERLKAQCGWKSSEHVDPVQRTCVEVSHHSMVSGSIITDADHPLEKELL